MNQTEFQAVNILFSRVHYCSKYRSKNDKMVMYTYAEMANMHLMYGRDNVSECEARWLYQDTFRNVKILNHRMSFSIDKQLRESDTLKLRTHDCGWQRICTSSWKKIFDKPYCYISIDKHKKNSRGS